MAGVAPFHSNALKQDVSCLMSVTGVSDIAQRDRVECFGVEEVCYFRCEAPRNAQDPKPQSLKLETLNPKP